MISDFKDKFILKGGMLVAVLVAIDMRSTIDMEATIKSYPVTERSIDDGDLILKEIFLDNSSDSYWIRYQRKYTYAIFHGRI